MKTSNKLLLGAFIVIVMTMIFSNQLNRSQIKVNNNQLIEINNNENTIKTDTISNIQLN